MVSDFEVVVVDLGYPEGPVAQPDGSVLLVDLKGARLLRVDPEKKTTTVVAETGGSPNGTAVGPDGAIYLCNSGGFESIEPKGLGVCFTGDQPADYKGGSIQRVDKGEVTTLYTAFEATDPLTGVTQTHSLRGPDDLVFDSGGGFWFSDWGKTRGRDRDITGVYYAKPDGSSIEEKIYPVAGRPNGIALSPDEKRLYIAETYSRRVTYFELEGPGKIRLNPYTTDGEYLLTADIGGILDSMAVDEQGNLYVATMLPQGFRPKETGLVSGRITVVSPDGKILDYLEIDVGRFAPLPSNVCFGGPDRCTCYVTLGGIGLLVAAKVKIPGLKPAFEQVRAMEAGIG